MKTNNLIKMIGSVTLTILLTGYSFARVSAFKSEINHRT